MEHMMNISFTSSISIGRSKVHQPSTLRDVPTEHRTHQEPSYCNTQMKALDIYKYMG